MKKEYIKQIIREWIIRLDNNENLPRGIKALNFGLYEPYGIELVGSKTYDKDDDDWACEEDFVPAERSCSNLFIDESEDWNDVLELIVEILKELVSELSHLKLLTVKHITTGFNDGDLVIISYFD